MREPIHTALIAIDAERRRLEALADEAAEFGDWEAATVYERRVETLEREFERELDRVLPRANAAKPPVVGTVELPGGTAEVVELPAGKRLWRGEGRSYGTMAWDTRAPRWFALSHYTACGYADDPDVRVLRLHARRPLRLLYASRPLELARLIEPQGYSVDWRLRGRYDLPGWYTGLATLCGSTPALGLDGWYLPFVTHAMHSMGGEVMLCHPADVLELDAWAQQRRRGGR